MHPTSITCPWSWSSSGWKEIPSMWEENEVSLTSYSSQSQFTPVPGYPRVGPPWYQANSCVPTWIPTGSFQPMSSSPWKLADLVVPGGSCGTRLPADSKEPSLLSYLYLQTPMATGSPYKMGFPAEPQLTLSTTASGGPGGFYISLSAGSHEDNHTTPIHKPALLSPVPVSPRSPRWHPQHQAPLVGPCRTRFENFACLKEYLTEI